VRRDKRSNWRSAATAGVLTAAGLAAVSTPAHAAGLLDFFFGGVQQQRPSADVNSYAEPSIGPVAPASPNGTESVRQGSGDSGRGVAFCVRLCDGQHFPIEHVTNATPVETCRAMCPASKTKVYFGSGIGGAVSRDGQRYADLDTAFIYRKQLVANCTCNGKNAFGLAPYDMTTDPTLRPGDIVSTKDGFLAYSGKSGGGFTPIDSAAVAAQLNPTRAAVRLSQRAQPATPAAPASDDEDPGTIAPSPNAPLAGLRNQSLR
jgi:hypothetical protein